VEFYRSHGVEVEFVGHPLGEVVPPVPEVGERPSIALLPGSRRKEIRYNLPEMLATAARFAGRYELQMPVASTVEEGWLRQQIAELAPQGLPLEVHLRPDARQTLVSARAAIVASGTATVEAAVAGTPFAMVYRLSPLTYAVGKRLVKVPYYGMVNLIASRQVVPEMIQENFTAERLAPVLEELLAEGPRRRAMLDDLRQVRESLRASAGESAAGRAAAAVLRAAWQNSAAKA
jgi:lipid-A-disaccharide synthase